MTFIFNKMGPLHIIQEQSEDVQLIGQDIHLT